MTAPAPGPRVFFSTGEASGEMSAAALAESMRALEPGCAFSGIGGERFRAAGIAVAEDTRGWASMGPVEAVGKIPRLLAACLRQVRALCARPAAAVVLVDFGAFNLRLAQYLRRAGYRAPILYWFPPGAWLDDPRRARRVAAVASAIAPFVHQRDFYLSQGLAVEYFGHPLASLVAPRAPRAAAPVDGGTIALLPGSRRAEIARHLPVLLGAARRLREMRPHATIVVSAADGDADAGVRALAAPLDGVTIVRGARAALDAADVAIVASGTAVLEATLREVPSVAMYVVGRAQVRIARRVWRGRFVTLPNLLADREIVPELLQDAATPDALAQAAAALLRDPAPQIAAMRDVRAALGPPDALERTAAYVVERARGR